MDKTIHRLTLRLSAKFAMPEFIETLSDPKIVGQCIFNLSELLSKKYLLAKAGDPKFNIVNQMSDAEIDAVLRTSITSASDRHDSDLETLRLLALVSR